jgi:hypothetical protein
LRGTGIPGLEDDGIVVALWWLFADQIEDQGLGARKADGHRVMAEVLQSVPLEKPQHHTSTPGLMSNGSLWLPGPGLLRHQGELANIG